MFHDTLFKVSFSITYYVIEFSPLIGGCWRGDHTSQSDPESRWTVIIILASFEGTAKC